MSTVGSDDFEADSTTADDNLTLLYVVGKRRMENRPPIDGEAVPIHLIQLQSTSRGWTQRCATDPTLNVEYVRREDVDELKEWFVCDFTRFTLHETLEEATEHHTSWKTAFH